MPPHLNGSKLKSQFKREEKELNQINTRSTNAKLSEKTNTLIFKCGEIFSDSPTENWVVEMEKKLKQDRWRNEVGIDTTTHTWDAHMYSSSTSICFQFKQS